MGAQQAVFAVGGAVGPAVAGVILQTTGGYTAIITLTAVGFAVAADDCRWRSPVPRRRGTSRRSGQPAGELVQRFGEHVVVGPQAAAL
jgi:hypothetical protein